MSGTTHSTSLRRRVALAALVLVCVLSFGMAATPARADTPLDFMLKNRLGVTIRAVYLSPHQAGTWEEDVLGAKVLPDGRDGPIRFGAGQDRRGDIWDLKVVTSNGQKFEWVTPGFNLTKLSEITLYMQGGNAQASWK